MGSLHETSIQWATHAVNPIVAVDQATGKRGWSCTKIAPGCQHCYAETFNVGRFGTGHRYDVKGNAAVEWQFDEAAIESVLRRRKPATIFWCDMTDAFHENVPDAWLDRMFAAMALTPHLRHIVLTKRAARMREYMREQPSYSLRAAKLSLLPDKAFEDGGVPFGPWPLPNVALGVSVACQADANELIPELLATPAALRFVSYEPGIESIDWMLGATTCSHLSMDGAGPDIWRCGMCRGYLRVVPAPQPDCRTCVKRVAALDLIIIGGESGPKARPFDLAWARDTIRQCEAAGTAVMLKQVGARPTLKPSTETCEEWVANGRSGLWDIYSKEGSSYWRDENGYRQGYRIKLRDSHGGKVAEWPSDLQPYACSPEKWPWAVRP